MKNILVGIFWVCTLSLASIANTEIEDSELKLDFDALVQDINELYLKVAVGPKGCQDKSPIFPGTPFSSEDIKDLRDLHAAIEKLSKEKGWKNRRSNYAINEPGFEERWDIVGLTVYIHDSKPAAYYDLQKAKRFKRKHPELF